MAKSNLHTEYNFSLRRKAYKPNNKEIGLISKTNFNLSDWGHKKYSSLKNNIKEHHLLKQKDRCAFCRKVLEGDGYHEDIEHIIAKSRRKQWMFTIKNLVVTCRPCNRLKNADNNLAKTFRMKKKFPEDQLAFTTLNPHFESWNEHLTIKDIFIEAKSGSKGLETIKLYRLYRYQVCINISRDKRMKNNSRNVDFVLDRIRIGILNSSEKAQMDKALKYFRKRIK